MNQEKLEGQTYLFKKGKYVNAKKKKKILRIFGHKVRVRDGK